MKLQMYHYHCGNCDNEFKVPQLMEGAYGEFLLRCQTGDTVYLDAMDDSTFDEVSTIIKQDPMMVGKDDMTRAKVLHQIFGVACDLAPDQSEYNIGAFPVCPNCKSNNMSSWEPTYPPEIIEMELTTVTHKRWQALNNVDKTLLISASIRRFLEEKNKGSIIN